MAISILELFKISIGPSSSHTMGPMIGARLFAEQLQADGLLDQTCRVSVKLYGSLGLTGRAHGSDRGIMGGREGEHAESVDIDSIDTRLVHIRENRTLDLLKIRRMAFSPEHDLVFDRRHSLPAHPNGMQFMAYDDQGELVRTKTFYSIGGGFVMDPGEWQEAATLRTQKLPPYPFHSATALIAQCKLNQQSISELMLTNEESWRDEATIRDELLKRWMVMQESIRRGCHTAGTLPGNLHVRRRAPDLYEHLCDRAVNDAADPIMAMDWLSLYAMAVNEENAAGGRVVTAPTNGAAGIIPAVLRYYQQAKEAGATIVLGGGAPQMPGNLANGAWVEPTIWTGLPDDSPVVTEEIFGPCCHIRPFDTEEEVIALANSLPYGLAAAVWTENTSRALRVSAQIECGICWVNSWFLRDLRTAFGGSKQSGIGREGGVHSLEFYTEMKNVCIKL